jgi:hypothetical protein
MFNLIQTPLRVISSVFVNKQRDIKTNAISCPSRFANTQPKTSSGEPPSKVDDGKDCGSYCLKAYSHIYHQDTGEITRTIEGYDQDTNISNRVINACGRVVHVLGEDRYACGTTKLCFLGNMEFCDGTIYVRESNGKLINKFFKE